MVNLYSLLFIISEINDGWILVPKKWHSVLNLYSLLFIISEINDGWILVPKKEVNNQLSIWSEQAQSIKDI